MHAACIEMVSGRQTKYKTSIRMGAYRWNMIHCAVVAMLSWLSFSADSLESTASSV